MSRDVEHTDDGRWIVVVDGRRWRRADPALPDDVRARLLSHLGAARSAVFASSRRAPAERPAALEALGG